MKKILCLLMLMLVFLTGCISNEKMDTQRSLVTFSRISQDLIFDNKTKIVYFLVEM
jgi:uncharacterized protein YcfL